MYIKCPKAQGRPIANRFIKLSTQQCSLHRQTWVSVLGHTEELNEHDRMQSLSVGDISNCTSLWWIGMLIAQQSFSSNISAKFPQAHSKYLWEAFPRRVEAIIVLKRGLYSILIFMVLNWDVQQAHTEVLVILIVCSIYIFITFRIERLDRLIWKLN